MTKLILATVLLTSALQVTANESIWYQIEIGRAQAGDCSYNLLHNNMDNAAIEQCLKALKTYEDVELQIDRKEVQEYLQDTATSERVSVLRSFYHHIKLINAYWE